MFELESCIRGYHVYYLAWTPREGEVLHCVRELGNPEDPFAVAVKNDSDTVGHIPRKISCICSLFLRNGGTLHCIVTGKRRRSEDLPQGGMEVPSILRFSGAEELLDKAKKLLKERTLVTVKVDRIDKSESSHQGSKQKVEPVAMIKEETIDLGTFVQDSGENISTFSAQQPTGENNPQQPAGETEKMTLVNPLEGFATSSVPQPEARSGVWLRFSDIVLNETDRATIECGALLKDQQMNFAQRLLKSQFPNINGLRLTLLQEQPHSSTTSNALQILHVRSNHWIVAHTKAKGKMVHVYDTLYSCVDQASAGIIRANFRCTLQNIVMKPCQKQLGTSDCGPFAIAIATSLAFDEDVSTREYCQEKLRGHILTCFENKLLQPFP
jgi:hypothetical protein